MSSSKYEPWPCETTKEWKRMAKQAIQQSMDELDRMNPYDLDIGNPNHPANSGIFGYETGEFMKKQMK